MSNERQFLNTQLMFFDGSDRILVKRKIRDISKKLIFQKSFFLNLIKYSDINAIGKIIICCIVTINAV